MPRQAANLLVLFAAFLWGLSFYFQKEAMSHVGPLLFTGIRGAIASIALLPFVWREYRKSDGSGAGIIRYGLLGGLIFVLAGGLQQAGMITAHAHQHSLPDGPLCCGDAIPALASARRTTWIGGVGFGGARFCRIWLLGGGTLGAFSTGDLLIAASSLFWSLFMVVTSASGKLAKPLQYTFVQFVTVAAIALPLAAVFESVSMPAVTAAAPSLLFVGAIASALTYALMANVVRYIEASRAAILLSTEVLFAAALGYVLLGERLGALNWLGAAIVFAAVLLIQLAKPKNGKKAA